MRLSKIFLQFSVIVLLLSCNYRTPSKARLEKSGGITIPYSITVIEDKFEEAGPNFSLHYVILLDDKGCTQYLNEVMQSNEWKRRNGNWELNRNENRMMSNITFSPTTGKVSYNEFLL